MGKKQIGALAGENMGISHDQFGQNCLAAAG